MSNAKVEGISRMGGVDYLMKLSGGLLYVIGGTLSAFLVGRFVLSNGASRYGLTITSFFYVVEMAGVTVGLHRCFSHRAFSPSRGLKFCLVIAGSMGMGSVLTWAANHRRHHRYSDQEGDPHSPYKFPATSVKGTVQNFLNAHTAGIFEPVLSHQDHYVPDLLRDNVVRRLDGNYWLILPYLVSAVGFWIGYGTLTAALEGAAWGGLSSFLVMNTEFCVGSLCHLRGARPYHTADNSTNQLVVALLTFGEGWHNNHHAFPNSPNFGLDRYQLDVGYLIIRLFTVLGLAENESHTPTFLQREKRRRGHSVCVSQVLQKEDSRSIFPSSQGMEAAVENRSLNQESTAV